MTRASLQFANCKSLDIFTVDIPGRLVYLWAMKDKDFDRSRLLSFKGSYKSLKLRGFHFWKAFARDYMVWTNEGPEKHDGNDISIWKHLGGYVEINCLNSVFSKAIAKIICTPDSLEAYAKTSELFPNWKIYDFLIDMETLEVVKYEYKLHDSMWIFYDRKDEEGIDEVIREWHRAFDKKYRKFSMDAKSWVIPAIQKMYADGEINPFA